VRRVVHEGVVGSSRGAGCHGLIRAVPRAVTSTVTRAVTRAVTSTVTRAVPRAVTSTVTRAVPRAVTSTVTRAVTRAVTSAFTEAVTRLSHGRHTVVRRCRRAADGARSAPSGTCRHRPSSAVCVEPAVCGTAVRAGRPLPMHLHLSTACHTARSTCAAKRPSRVPTFSARQHCGAGRAHVTTTRHST
jgi:hypothetical protein